MINRKKRGSYYTPSLLADFIVSRVSPFLKLTTNRVLEPSAGDGVFVNSIIKLVSPCPRITVIEKNKHELNKVIKATTDSKIEAIQFLHGDFLEIQEKLRRKFTLAIGNPPYIRKRYLKSKQQKISKKIHLSASLADKQINNIWSAFLVRSIQLLDEDGILAFVLPAEILQVKFAEELRKLVYKSFERVEFFNFREIVFDAEGQNTVLLIGYKKSKEPGVYYSTINKLEDLKSNQIHLTKNDIIHSISTKEIHYNLSSDDLDFLTSLKKKVKLISDYASSKPGIVTASNNYFIVSKSKRREYALSQFTKPIIQKGLFVNGKVEFNKNDWDELANDNYPCYLLDFNDVNISKANSKVKSYLRLGERLEISDRFKCQQRRSWYRITNIVPPSDAFFFKRCNIYPKFIKNEANVYATDSAYMVNANSGISINTLIYSFYNSLTLLFAELEGRYYGGGVLELTPLEFKSLPIPYTEVKSETFKTFSNDFKNKTSINQILNANDPIILGRSLGLNSDEISKLRRIRETVVSIRLKSNI